ncbi:MAG: cellulose binding domain-containing protein [Alphaproteobacteria bacterium]
MHRGAEHPARARRGHPGLVAVALALACSLLVGEARAACSVDYAVTSDWGAGFIASVAIHNDGAAVVSSWTLAWSFGGGQSITSSWSANATQQGSAVTATNAAWNASIPVGGSVSFGFQATTAGANSAPSSFVLNGTACSLQVVMPTPGPATPTPFAPTPTPTPITGPLPSSATAWPAQVFAPFVDATGWPPFPLVDVATNQHVGFFALGFVVAGSNGACTPTWGTYYDTSTFLSSDIAALRAIGGDVVVSFGGAANTELALACGNATSVAQAYRTVIERYGLTHVDFDVEGAAIANHAATDRRSQAIATLQAEAHAAGRTLEAWFTLPVLPTGLTADGLYLLRSALSHGVEIGLVNVMAMDYCDSAAPSPSGQMGEYAIQAATSLFSQLRTVHDEAAVSITDAELWRLVGVTPMIGVNDVETEVFDLVDAGQLLDFARAHGIGAISMWSANRDHPCPGGPSPHPANDCSSIAQADGGFSQTFLALGGSTTPTSTPTPAASPTPAGSPGPTPPPACAAAPRTGCVSATSGQLSLKRGSSPARDKLAFTWKGTTAGPFSDPTSGLAICAWDHSGGTPLLAIEAVPATGLACSGRSGWKSTSAGWVYADRAGASDGVTSLKLARSTSGLATIVAKASGATILPDPPDATRFFADDPAIVVQVDAGAAGCFELRLASPATRNDPAAFSDR